MALKIKHKLGSVVFAQNSQQSLELARTGPLIRLWLNLSYTVTNGGVAAVGPLFQTLARLIQRIEVQLGGRDTVWSIPGYALAALVQLQRRQAFGMDTAIALGAGAATAYRVVIPLDFTLYGDGNLPMDTLLDLRRTLQASLKISWGPSDTSDFYATPNAAAITNVVCDVEGEYYLFDDPAGAATFMVRELAFFEQTPAANSANYEFIVDRQSGLFIRNLMLIATDAKVGSDAVINNVELRSSNQTFYQSNNKVVKAQNLHEFNNGQALMAGIYYVPLPTFGQGVSMINTAALSDDLRLVLDITLAAGTTRIGLVREAIRPLKVA